MKLLIIGLVVGAAIGGTLTVQGDEPQRYAVVGDANCSGQTDITDALRILEAQAGIIPYGAIPCELGDAIPIIGDDIAYPYSTPYPCAEPTFTIDRRGYCH